jgi:hypothetical protein
MPEGTDSPAVIHYSTTPFDDFPLGHNPSDFAMEATGYVDVIGGASIRTALYVDSDDGFRLRLNGRTVSEFPGWTSHSNRITPMLTLNDGDLIRLTYFERTRPRS